MSMGWNYEQHASIEVLLINLQIIDSIMKIYRYKLSVGFSLKPEFSLSKIPPDPLELSNLIETFAETASST